MNENKPVLGIFEPAMCCSSGLCGPDVDPTLVAFAGDVDWLKRQGAEIRRYNLSQAPAAFVNNAVVYEAINASGLDILPLLVVENDIVSQGRYPQRAELAEIARVGEAASFGEEPEDSAGALISLLDADPADQSDSYCGGDDPSCC